MVKFITAEEAVTFIKDNDTVGMSGHGAMCVPEDLIVALANRYKETEHPKNLRVMKGVALGDFSPNKGLTLATQLDGLIGTVITAHTALEPATVEAVKQNKMMCYLLPYGTVQQLLRSMAGKKPGLLTNVGLKTFVDPRQEGGKGNALTKEKGEDIVKLVEIDGKEALFYPYFPMNACFIRASLADKEGNISFQDEAVLSHLFEMATATSNAGGTVIVVVNEVVEVGSIHPKAVGIPGFMVDYVVKASPENRAQSLEFDCMRPELAGHYNIPISTDFLPLELNERKICGRRAAMEISKNAMLNLGIGIPEAVSAVANEEGVLDQCTITIETGIFGGVPLMGISFGAVANPRVIMRADDTMQWYDGGGLDMTCLGAAEIDQRGNVNASCFNGRSIGPGGFVDISQNTPRVCFLGTFTAGGLKVSVGDGKLTILQEGKIKKLKKQVEQITFSADYAVETGQDVLYITERAVFKAMPEGLTLIEIAPGMDIERDIIANMEFSPCISPDLKLMDERIFRDEKMGLNL